MKLFCWIFGHVPQRMPDGSRLKLGLAFKDTGFLAGGFFVCRHCHSVYWMAK